MNKISLKDALKCVEVEDELPGEMPQEMYDELHGLNKRDLTESLRILVRMTKKSISDRLKKLE